MVTDPISDFIIRIKNASDARKATVSIPYSKMKFAIAEVLVEEGFIKAAAKKGKKVNKTIDLTLSYEGDEPRVQGVDRISKFSRRVYEKSKNLRKVKGGLGHAIITTPKGIMTERDAKKEHVGGEILFKIW